MMKCRIKETGEIKELCMRDAKSGMDWEGDFIGNHGGFVDNVFVQGEAFTEEADLWLVSAEDFEWWANIANEYEALNERIVALQKNYGSEIVQEAIQNLWNVDLENQIASVTIALDEFEREKAMSNSRNTRNIKL